MTEFILKQHHDLAKMVIWHRKKGKISQQMLADLADVSRTAVQRLESGVTPVQTDTLWKVLKVLNIRVLYDGPLIQNYQKTLAELQDDTET